MKVLITGGAGFVGNRLAAVLLARGELAGKALSSIVLADQVQARGAVLDDARVSARVGPLIDQCAALREEAFDAVFHLASAVSGECEADFELGLRSNLDSTRALLDALRHRTERGHAPTRLVFSSSVAVFGPDPAFAWSGVVGDDTLPTPQTSYGIQKLICEHLVADYTRKGFIDGRSARLMTVTVRPGKANGAASSFFSAIIREPLAGQEALLPVDGSVSHPVSSPTAPAPSRPLSRPTPLRQISFAQGTSSPGARATAACWCAPGRPKARSISPASPGSCRQASSARS